jgi:glycosyltransferase involved in cell wall biosynthesis
MNLISVIIPTRNNPIVLLENVEQLIKNQHRKITYFVVDNSQNKNLEVEKIFEDLKDFHYYYNEKKLSFTENFEFIIPFIKTKYISFIGDDDLIHPSFGEIFYDLDKKYEFDVLIGNNKFRYYWQDVKHPIFKNKLATNLFESNYNSQAHYINIRRELETVGRTAADRFFDLPKVYHGVVSLGLLQNIKKKTGFYFPGPTPDMGFAAHAAYECKKLLKFDFPMFILGTCGNSGGGKGLIKKHNWNIENCPWLDKRISSTWNDACPKYLSGTTIWTESFLRAKKNYHDTQLKFNYNKLLAKLIVFDWKTNNKDIKCFVKKYQYHAFPFVFYYILVLLATRIIMLLKNMVKLCFNKNKFTKLKQVSDHIKKYHYYNKNELKKPVNKKKDFSFF